MSETSDSAAGLFRQGRLADAVQAANAAVRAAPAEIGARILLAELLVFAGDRERADKILDAASGLDPTAALPVAEFRQLLRADIARHQLVEGRSPEFLDGPTPTLREILAAHVALRGGDLAAATAHAQSAEAERPRTPGRSGDEVFDDFRDVDDLYNGFFEVLTTTGKYFWIPTERVASVEFHAPRRPRDLLWRRATMSVTNGPDGDVYVPAIYAVAPGEDVSDSCRLGRITEWREQDGAPVRGLGLRTFLAGDEAPDILGLGSLEFS